MPHMGLLRHTGDARPAAVTNDLLDCRPGESLRRYAKHRRPETRARPVPSEDGSRAGGGRSRPLRRTVTITLLCPVRECGAPLTSADGCLRCPRRHTFDVARSGYVN